MCIMYTSAGRNQVGTLSQELSFSASEFRKSAKNKMRDDIVVEVEGRKHQIFFDMREEELLVD